MIADSSIPAAMTSVPVTSGTQSKAALAAILIASNTVSPL
jgi:hypothetical protein